jgi:hypothetical protein
MPNAWTFKYNLYTGSTVPLIMPGNFAAGTTATVNTGDILERTANSNTEWVTINADEDFTGTDDALAVAAEEIKSGDRAGYYKIIIPRPGDVFRFALATAAATALGASLYYSGAQTVAASGTYAIGFSVTTDHFPDYQGHLSDDASPDSGTTIKSLAYVDMVFAKSRSYYLTLEPS